MKRKSSITLGPGAPSLILIFVILALSMLSMLALMTGRNDYRLSRRSVQVMESVYELNTQAELTRAELDGILAAASLESSDDGQYLQAVRKGLAKFQPGAEAADVQPDEAAQNQPEEPENSGAGVQDLMITGREISWIQTDGARNLHCALEIQPLHSETRSSWRQHTLVSAVAEETEDGLVEFD